MKRLLTTLVLVLMLLPVAARAPRGVKFIERRANHADGKPYVWFAFVIDQDANKRLKFNAVEVEGGTTPSKLYAAWSEYGQGRPVVVANAGFFNMRTLESVSLLMDEGRVEAADVRSVSRTNANGQKVDVFPIHAAFGQMPDGSYEAQWIFCQPEKDYHPYVYPFAVGNDDSLRLYSPVPPAVGQLGSYPWQVVDAVAAGPMLVKNGRDVSLESSLGESYYRTIGGKARHNRTAIGLTDDGKLVIMVVDGRGMNGSVGCTLSELAEFLMELGVVEGVNLDGGGSSAIVNWDGELVNHPSDGGKRPERIERVVPTFVVISEEK